jgi:hypothetical protein
MVYFKRFNGRRYRRRYSTRGKYRRGKIVRYGKRFRNKVRQQIYAVNPPEFKQQTVKATVGAFAYSSTGVGVNLFPTIQGRASYERLGDSLIAKPSLFKIQFWGSSTATGNIPIEFEFAIVAVEEGADTFDFENLLQYHNTSGSPYKGMRAELGDTVARTVYKPYRVLHHRVITIEPDARDGKVRKVTFKIPRWTQRFSSNVNTSQDGATLKFLYRAKPIDGSVGIAGSWFIQYFHTYEFMDTLNTGYLFADGV